MVSCAHCYRFRVLPDGVCEGCGWDNDGHGMVAHARPDYCFDSPTKKHGIPRIVSALKANYCRYCAKTIEEGKTKNEVK